MLKKLKNSLVVLFLLGAIVLPLSNSKNFNNTTNKQNTNTAIQLCVPSDQHDIK
ncbi:hypothetical protein SAMN02746066_03831 [Anaerosporobacter mobilis DSM 15930]|uniref:Uncharacterized protein n=1 Tax=Anaerosporobacter mobilis DSM 15930 TaxID=1120996 RepID=A0A1M7MHS0_9FIRM|nr:hypothetical protein [Anaerosporobacter mobilis]SHM90500.1 hypothetical protein SAMN02746066_03831 [Anaerosporobacter mobilis DSM 15930]